MKKKRKFLIALDAIATSDYSKRDLMEYIKEAIVAWAKGGDPDSQLFDLDDKHVTVKSVPDD